MKSFVVLSAVFALCVAAAPWSRAQSASDMKEMDTADGDGARKKSQSQRHKATGTVKKIDPVGGKVAIAHGPIQSLKWPAMTMSFAVKDKKLLDKLAPEKKIEFEFVKQGSEYVITSFR